MVLPRQAERLPYNGIDETATVSPISGFPDSDVSCCPYHVVKAYSLKLNDREEGPYTEAQISQLFADGGADRNTPCRVAPDGLWRTIDDLLPMLKYGTQLPAPTSPAVRSEDPAFYGAPPMNPPALPPREVAPSRIQVSVVDFDLPFGSILKLIFKWTAAAFVVFCCFIPVAMLLFFILMAIFGSVVSGMLHGFQSP